MPKPSQGNTAPTTLPAPEVEEELAEELLETAFILPSDEELDTGDLIDAAEELLRQGAPHDFDVAIIGAGPGGLACALKLSQSDLKVCVIEAREVGGVALNRGAIPVQTWLESVNVLRQAKHAGALGVGISGEITADFTAMQNRVRARIEARRAAMLRQLEDADTPVLRGTARFVDQHTLEISPPDARTLTAVHVVIATGSRPTKAPVEGCDLEGVLNSDEILELQMVPSSLIILGGGAVGVSFAALFAQIGTRVCLIEESDALLPGEDGEIQDALRHNLEANGVEVICGAKLQRIENGDAELRARFECAGEIETRGATLVLMATEWRANLDDLNLEAAGVEIENGRVWVDENNETATSGVWAIGDCLRGDGWAHQAAWEGRKVADGIRGLTLESTPFMPACYRGFFDVATLGLTLKTALELGLDAREGRAELHPPTPGEAGLIKIVIEADGKILGAHIIGPGASELIGEIVLALRAGTDAQTLAALPHAQGTNAETLADAARDALYFR